MEDKLLTGALVILALLMLALMPRVVKGPRFTDRIVAVNAINTMVTASIVLLSRLHRAPYRNDTADTGNPLPGSRPVYVFLRGRGLL